MAPAVVQRREEEELSTIDLPIQQKKTLAPQASEPTVSENKFNYTPGFQTVNSVPREKYAYEDLTPSFPDVKWAPLSLVPYSDKGLLGSPTFHNLLSAATSVVDYTPKIGTEITGVKLNALTDLQKNDLARLLAYRGVVFFRDQHDLTVDQQLDLGRYWGTLHTHPTTALPKRAGLDEIHVVWSDENSIDQAAVFPLGYAWHSDVTFELQPPSYTSLKLIAAPPPGAGGDTIWSSGYGAYDALSPHLQKYLEGLTAEHSAEEQAQGSRILGRPVRREPIKTNHPIVRTHPVTGWKSLFLNPGFVRRINGVPRAESDAILRHLNQVMVETAEIHARFAWREGDVAIWDNRVTNHSATYAHLPHRRHALRVAPHGEVPVFDPNGTSQEAALSAALGRQVPNKDGGAFLNYND
ncbi:hypothetical protein DFH27DRAFT_312288 [Peziza echinospora]|nr:hypothetical protein DFH27DRAFT_312288 [Peziza echinospora]